MLTKHILRQNRIGDILLHPEDVIVYCSGSECDEASLLAQLLLEMGETNVLHFEGGFTAWEQAGYPTSL